MSFATRLKKLTSYIYSPTNPASEDAIREQIDDSIQEVYDNVTDVLSSTTQGDSGAFNTGINSTGVTASNVEDAVAEVQANVAGATLGLIPDNTLTEAKMADEMKKQVGGVAEYDTVATNTTNISTNASNITTINNELDIVRTAADSTGSLDAYILDTPATFDFTVDGNLVNFNPNFTNAGTSTISVDGTTKAIRKYDIDTSAYVVLEAEDIKKNNPIQLRYDVSEGFFVLAPKSSGAWIKNIQHGIVTVNAATDTFTLATAVEDYTKCIVVINFSGSVTSTYEFDNTYVKAKLISNTTLQTNKYVDDGSDLRVGYMIIEVDDSKVKQFVFDETTYNVTSGTVGFAITIPEVDMSKTLVFSNYMMDYSVSIDNFNSAFYHYLSSSTEITYNRRNSGSTVELQINTWVIELK